MAAEIFLKEIFQRKSEAGKLAPIEMESPQLKQGFCALASEDL